MTPVLGYWKIRGLAGPIRLLLEQVNANYIEKNYYCGPSPDYERPEWLADKKNLGLDFANLPYYLDEDVKLTQSRVIIRYLARKHRLDGGNNSERIRADLADTQAYEYFSDYAKIIAFNRNFVKHTPAYLITLRERLEKITKFLGERKFVAGSSVTYADFTLFEFLESQRSFEPNVMRNQPILCQFIDRMNKLEAVERYFASPEALKGPFFGAPAFVDGPYSKQRQASLN